MQVAAIPQTNMACGTNFSYVIMSYFFFVFWNPRGGERRGLTAATRKVLESERSVPRVQGLPGGQRG
jgi:hypothetical protein